jgi:hypothetical protein
MKKLNLSILFMVLITMSIIGTSCKSGVVVKYANLNINNLTSDEIYVRCSIDFTSWEVTKNEDRNTDTVTIPPNSSGKIKLAYNPDTTDGLNVGVAESGTDEWFRYHYRNRLTSSYYTINIKKTKNPDNLYKVSIN